MRRTRHVTLPVRSWQYIGLLVVSLACLTLGLVSRDREGRHGSLAGPELQHIAPHKVDACPNISPYAPTCSSSTVMKNENDNENKIPETSKTSLQLVSSRRLQSSPQIRENRIQRERFLDDRSRARTVKPESISPENRRRIFERQSREIQNLQNDHLQFRQQYNYRAGRMRDNRLVRSQTQSRQDQNKRISQEIRQVYRTEAQRSFRTPEKSHISQQEKSHSFDRMSPPIIQRRTTERQILLIRRTNPHIRISRSNFNNPSEVRVSERSNIDFRRNSREVRVSERSNIDFRRNSRDPITSVKNSRTEHTTTRELKRDNLDTMRSSQSLDRISSGIRKINVYTEKRDFIMKKISNKELQMRRVNQIQKRARVSNDFRSNSRDLIISNRDSSNEHTRNRETQRRFFSREDLMQRRMFDARMNAMNKHAINRRIDLSRRDAIDFRNQASAAERRISLEKQHMVSRLSERRGSDERIDIRRIRSNKMFQNNVVESIQSRREVRAPIKIENAQEYLKYQTSNVLNYEVLRQALVIALCIIYGSSIYSDKNSVVKRIASQMNRLVSA